MNASIAETSDEAVGVAVELNNDNLKGKEQDEEDGDNRVHNDTGVESSPTELVEKENESPMPPPPPAAQRETATFKVPLGPAHPTQVQQKSCRTDREQCNKQETPGGRKRAPSACPPCPYVEPDWSQICDFNYSFDVLKGGRIISTHDLCGVSHMTFGRLASCSVKLDHPSLSRYHAVVQIGDFEQEGKPGVYVYDMGSVHGTFVNKKRVEANKYVRLRVGHCVKFAGSSRMFILQGPEEDVEPESASSITELKELRQRQTYIVDQRRKLKQAQLEDEERSRDQQNNEGTMDEEEQGASWGMGADAKTIYSTNARCVFDQPQDEQIYLADPKKTLRGYFEREGLQMPEYEVTEGSKGTFKCSIDLPLDDNQGHPLHSEVETGGKKKEAIVQCALQACRILDMYGELRKANIESRARKRHQRLADEDDDDDFFDRTGMVEIRRERRKLKNNKKTNEGKALSHKETVILLEKCNSEITKLTDLLEKSKKDIEKLADDGLDALDAFMLQMKSGVGLDLATKQRYKRRLVELTGESKRLQHLVRISQPCLHAEVNTQQPPRGQTATSTDSKSMKLHTGVLDAGKSTLPTIATKEQKEEDAGTCKPGEMLKSSGGKVNHQTEDDDQEKKEEEERKDIAANSTKINSAIKKRVPRMYGPKLEGISNQINQGEMEKKEVRDVAGEEVRGVVEDEVRGVAGEKMSDVAGDDVVMDVAGEDVVMDVAGEKEGSTTRVNENVHTTSSTLEGVPTSRDGGGGREVGGGSGGGGGQEEKVESKENKSQNTQISSEPIEFVSNKTEKKPPRKRYRKPKDKQTEKKLCLSTDYVEDDKHATWMPPQGQKGDGRTALNDKFGY